MKVKKLISLAAALVMMSALPAVLPASAHEVGTVAAVVPGASIEKIDITARIPRAGDSPSTYPYEWVREVSDDIEVGNIQWITDKTMHSHMSSNDVFEAGKTYTAVFYFSMYGYNVNESTKVTVNGMEATYEPFESSGAFMGYSVDITIPEPEELKRADITITAPEIGEKPDYKIKAVTPEGSLNIYKSYISLDIGKEMREYDTFIWFEHIDGGAGYSVEPEDTFKEGHTYTAELEMSSGSSYTITKDTEIYVNGVKAVPSEYNDYVDTVYYSVDFKVEKKYQTGDVNGDGNIDIEDAVQVIGHVNGQKALVDDEAKRADVDGNKAIDIEDAVAIISHVNGVKVLGS